MTYDSATDSKQSWLEAVRAIRRKGLLTGKYEPVNDDERELLKHSGVQYENSMDDERGRTSQTTDRKRMQL